MVRTNGPTEKWSELQLNAGLEELRLANEAEAVERAVSVGHLEPHIVRKVPIHHRRESPELPSLYGTACEIGVGEPVDDFPRPRSSLKDRARRRNLFDKAAAGVVGTNFTAGDPEDDRIHTLKKWVAFFRSVDLLDVVLVTD